MSVRLARSEMKSMPSELMAPHVLIAMMTRRNHVGGDVAVLVATRVGGNRKVGR